MKRWIRISLIFAMCFCLAGCEKKQETKEPAQSENMIHLFQVKENQVVLASEDYQLKTPDVLSTSVEDVMTKLMTLPESRIESYTYMIAEDSSVQMELTLKEGDYQTEDTMLLMAAVTKTLFQLEAIDGIELSLKDSFGEIKEEQSFGRSSFYYYDYEEPALNQENVTLYVPDDQGTMLRKVVVKETAAPQVSNQELIVRELVKMGVLPQNTKVNQVSVYGTTCYLDLSGEFLYSIGNSTPDLTLYALVDSIIAQTGIDNVQILVDGELEKTYRNVADISEPLSFNSDFVEKEN